MATRPPRLRIAEMYFHVMSRGTNRWNIFLDDLDRERFMHLLAVICKRYEVEVHAFCLMGNHFHLVLYCPEPVLSAAMRDLKSRYAKYFNARHRGTGPVFEAPFVEVPILSDEQLLTVIRYVHRNPLELDPNACLATYLWSSHGIYLGMRPTPQYVNVAIGLSLFGSVYRRTIEAPLPHDKVQNLYRPRPLKAYTPGVSSFSESESVSLAGIQRAIATAAVCELTELGSRNRNGLAGLAVVIAIDVGGFTLEEIAEPYGYSSRQVVSRAAKRTRERLALDGALAEVHRQVVMQFQAAA